MVPKDPLILEGVLQGCSQGVGRVCCLIRRLSEGRNNFWSHYTTVGRIQFLTGWWTQVRSSLLTVGQRLSSSPCPGTPPQGSTQRGRFCLQRKHRKGVRESMSKMEVPVYYNLILKSLLHHICHLLLIGRYLPGPAQAEGKGFAQRHEYWVVEVTGNHFRSSLPHNRILGHCEDTRFLNRDLHVRSQNAKASRTNSWNLKGVFFFNTNYAVIFFSQKNHKGRNYK